MGDARPGPGSLGCLTGDDWAEPRGGLRPELRAGEGRRRSKDGRRRRGLRERRLPGYPPSGCRLQIMRNLSKLRRDEPGWRGGGDLDTRRGRGRSPGPRPLSSYLGAPRRGGPHAALISRSLSRPAKYSCHCRCLSSSSRRLGGGPGGLRSRSRSHSEYRASRGGPYGALM